MSFRKTSSLFKIINNTLVDLPAPSNLSMNWNYGSILGLILVIQLVSGIVISMRYTCHASMAFNSVINMTQDSSYGWLLRLIHATGASFFFLFLYLHMGRSIYYGSYTKASLWNVGVLIYLLLMGTAFLGYVLPWGQMSYWAATVITNLLSAIPFLGSVLVEWVWGGFSVDNPTLIRFYSLHFVLPFIVSFLVVIHIFYLHMFKSINPMGLKDMSMKISFFPLYIVKDVFYFIIFLFIFFFSCLNFGYLFMDAENFIPANSLITPLHIQPEWYFLFAYAILRSVPNKLGGVMALAFAVLILFLLPIGKNSTFIPGLKFNILKRFIFWNLVFNFLVLTWLGSCPAEMPFIFVSQMCSIFYFLFFGLIWILA